MPRTGRVVVPQYPHHIVQRGHDRNVVFASESDFRYYLDTLAEFKELYGVSMITSMEPFRDRLIGATLGSV